MRENLNHMLRTSRPALKKKFIFNDATRKVILIEPEKESTFCVSDLRKDLAQMHSAGIFIAFMKISQKPLKTAKRAEKRAASSARNRLWEIYWKQITTEDYLHLSRTLFAFNRCECREGKWHLKGASDRCQVKCLTFKQTINKFD